MIEPILNECFSYLLKKNKKYMSRRNLKKVLKRHFKEVFQSLLIEQSNQCITNNDDEFEQGKYTFDSYNNEGYEDVLGSIPKEETLGGGTCNNITTTCYPDSLEGKSI